MAFNSQGQRLNSFGQPFTGNKIRGVQKRQLMGSAGGGGLDEFHKDNPGLPNNFARPFGSSQAEAQNAEPPPQQMQPGWMESLFPGTVNQHQQQPRLNSFGEPMVGNKIRGVQRRRNLSGDFMNL